MEFLEARDEDLNRSDAKADPFVENKAAEIQDSQQTNLQSYQLARDRSRRQIKAPVRYGYVDLIAYALMSAEDMPSEEPASYSEAIKSEKCDRWIEAMKEEVNSLHRNQTWTLVLNPGDKKLQGKSCS